jgi:hypothetical protein
MNKISKIVATPSDGSQNSLVKRAVTLNLLLIVRNIFRPSNPERTIEQLEEPH